MKQEKYYFKISPGVLKDDIIPESYDGNNFGVYSAMTEILSGGTNGSSILTGLTLPILFLNLHHQHKRLSSFPPKID